MGRWIPTVRTDLGRECRHAFGHAVYYWLAMRDQPARRLRGFSSFGHTLRVGGPRGLQLSKREMDAGIATCADAAAMHPSLVTDCINGLFHSYGAMSPRPDAAIMGIQKEYDTGGAHHQLAPSISPARAPTGHPIQCRGPFIHGRVTVLSGRIYTLTHSLTHSQAGRGIESSCTTRRDGRPRRGTELSRTRCPPSCGDGSRAYRHRGTTRATARWRPPRGCRTCCS